MKDKKKIDNIKVAPINEDIIMLLCQKVNALIDNQNELLFELKKLKNKQNV